MTGQHDVVFGATVSGRPAEIPDVEQMVGLFINTIPVRVQIREDETLAGLLARVQAEQAALLAHHHLPLPQIQRIAGGGVLFDTLTVFENYPVGEMMAEDSQTVPGLRVAGAEGRDATHYPIALIVGPAQRLRIRVDYQPALFDQAAAEQITTRLIRILQTAAAGPASRSPRSRCSIRVSATRSWRSGTTPPGRWRRGRCRSCSRLRWRPARTRSRWSAMTAS
jgi:non-ribosomal peptide synthetase component F